MTDLNPARIAELQSDGTITGGMIPKLDTCVHAVEGGVDAAVILDGRVPHAMLLEIFTRQGAGYAGSRIRFKRLVPRGAAGLKRGNR